MKHVLSLLFISGICLASVLAAKPTQEQLKALEKLMEKAPLVEEDPEFDDGAEETGARSWNPLNWFKSKLKNKCVCEDQKCECCFKFKVFKNTGCLAVQTYPEEKKIGISFKMDDKEMVKQRFDLNRKDEICGSVTPPFEFAKFCLAQQSELESESSFTSCVSIDFRIGGTVGAVLQFRCLDIKDGKLSYGGYKEVEKSNMLVLKVKSPFKAAVALYKKALGKK